MSSATAKSAVKTAQIGGKTVPAMAIGTWAWGDARQWGWNEKEDFPKLQDAWKASLEGGLTFYDTAEVYGMGKSEQIISRLIKETDEETREKLYIATKVLPAPVPTFHFYLFRPPVVDALKASLRRLGLDSVNLYQMHRYPILGSNKAWAAGLAECVKLGLCKSVGVSNYSLEEMIEFEGLLKEHDIPLASNQVEFNLLRQLPETSGLLAEMKKRNIALLAYSPLAMGRLTGKFNKENLVPSNRKFSGQHTLEDIEPLIEELRTLAKKYDVTPAAVALNWVIQKGAIPLGGARNQNQAEQNAKALTFDLTTEEVDLLSSKGFEGKTDRFWQHA